MEIDFFVHPEYAMNLNVPFYEEYMESIRETYERSEFPVLIDSSISGEFSDQFPLEKRIKSASIDEWHIKQDKGEVAPDDWEKFTDIVGQGDLYKIHGSFLGGCVNDFAKQLIGYVMDGEHWHDWWGMINDDESREEEFKLNEHEAEGDIVNSGIRYGTVLAPLKRIEIQTPSPLKVSLGIYTFCDHSYQMMDESTSIFNSDKVYFKWDPSSKYQMNKGFEDYVFS